MALAVQAQEWACCARLHKTGTLVRTVGWVEKTWKAPLKQRENIICKELIEIDKKSTKNPKDTWESSENNFSKKKYKLAFLKKKKNSTLLVKEI